MVDAEYCEASIEFEEETWEVLGEVPNQDNMEGSDDGTDASSVQARSFALKEVVGMVLQNVRHLKQQEGKPPKGRWCLWWEWRVS